VLLEKVIRANTIESLIVRTFPTHNDTLICRRPIFVHRVVALNSMRNRRASALGSPGNGSSNVDDDASHDNGSAATMASAAEKVAAWHTSPSSDVHNGDSPHARRPRATRPHDGPDDGEEMRTAGHNREAADDQVDPAVPINRKLSAIRGEPSKGPPHQTPQFWFGVAIGGLLNILVVPLVLWAWSASNPTTYHLPHAAAGSTRITRRRALYFGLVCGSGCSVAVLSLALTIYVVSSAAWPLTMLIATSPGLVLGPVLGFRGLHGWLELQRRYRMRQVDIFLVIGLMGITALVLAGSMIAFAAGALTRTM
jgi:hypothetical protein